MMTLIHIRMAILGKKLTVFFGFSISVARWLPKQLLISQYIKIHSAVLSCVFSHLVSAFLLSSFLFPHFCFRFFVFAFCFPVFFYCTRKYSNISFSYSSYFFRMIHLPYFLCFIFFCQVTGEVRCCFFSFCFFAENSLLLLDKTNHFIAMYLAKRGFTSLLLILLQCYINSSTGNKLVL